MLILRSHTCSSSSVFHCYYVRFVISAKCKIWKLCFSANNCACKVYMHKETVDFHIIQNLPWKRMFGLVVHWHIYKYMACYEVTCPIWLWDQLSFLDSPPIRIVLTLEETEKCMREDSSVTYVSGTLSFMVFSRLS
jgi:hypothetical protein